MLQVTIYHSSVYKNVSFDKQVTAILTERTLTFHTALGGDKGCG